MYISVFCWHIHPWIAYWVVFSHFINRLCWCRLSWVLRYSTFQLWFCVFLGANIVSWKAKKQTIVARSSTEAEYHAVAHCVVETMWIHHSLCELGVLFFTPFTIYCDNISVIYVALNPVFYARTEHIKLDFHFVRERIASGDQCIRYVPTADLLANIFTKGPRYTLLRSNLSGYYNYFLLRGSIYV